MTEIMPVPRNLSFTVLPAESLCPASFYSLKENHLYLEVIFFIIDGVLQYQGFQGRFQGYG